MSLTLYRRTSFLMLQRFTMWCQSGARGRLSEHVFEDLTVPIERELPFC
jgi:hypothetical protein